MAELVAARATPCTQRAEKVSHNRSRVQACTAIWQNVAGVFKARPAFSPLQPFKHQLTGISQLAPCKHGARG